MTAEWPDEERRTGDADDIGRRRRMTDVDMPPTPRQIERALNQHENEAQAWRAAHDARLEMVERRASLLDGVDGAPGLLSQMGGFSQALTEIREDIRDLKAKADRIDGHTTPPPPKSRAEKISDFALKFVLPIVLAMIPVVGVIIVGYLQLKGQLIDLQSGTGR